jgi:hypothetical protein
MDFHCHSGARPKQTSPESITTIGKYGPWACVPQVGIAGRRRIFDMQLHIEE